jgi:hypothetical protein
MKKIEELLKEKEPVYQLKMQELDVYEEDQKNQTEELKRQKISTPVIRGLIKDMQSTSLEPLKIIGSKVMGNLFDRVKFLRERIVEIKIAIKEREKMNETFNQEIDSDIAMMEDLIVKISDREELREFKLNVSLLRMEKRKENTQFWRDIVDLKTQLKELLEDFEVESKLANIFDGLNLN